MNTPVEMKLSEQLIKLAEWWLSSDGLPAFSHGGNAHMYRSDPNYHNYTDNETVANVCLLESEFQKDIESDSESTNTELLVQMD